MPAIIGVRRKTWLSAVLAGLSVLGACGDDDEAPAQTERACESAEQCYAELEGAELAGGEAVCLDRVEAGYCTHLCASDADCCAVPGECVSEQTQVCSPFESSDEMYCFLSCEDADLERWQAESGDAFCQRFAHAGFRCRSSGGGSENRKVCVP